MPRRLACIIANVSLLSAHFEPSGRLISEWCDGLPFRKVPLVERDFHVCSTFKARVMLAWIRMVIFASEDLGSEHVRRYPGPRGIHGEEMVQ